MLRCPPSFDPPFALLHRVLHGMSLSLTSLPPELLAVSFRKLSVASLMHVSETCRDFSDTLDEEFWKAYVIARNSALTEIPDDDTISWKKMAFAFAPPKKHTLGSRLINSPPARDYSVLLKLKSGNGFELDHYLPLEDSSAVADERGWPTGPRPRFLWRVDELTGLDDKLKWPHLDGDNDDNYKHTMKRGFSIDAEHRRRLDDKFTEEAPAGDLSYKESAPIWVDSLHIWRHSTQQLVKLWVPDPEEPWMINYRTRALQMSGDIPNNDPPGDYSGTWDYNAWTLEVGFGEHEGDHGFVALSFKGGLDGDEVPYYPPIPLPSTAVPLVFDAMAFVSMQHA